MGSKIQRPSDPTLNSNPLVGQAIEAIREASAANPGRYVAKYSEDPRAFISWLEENWHVWIDFHSLAVKLLNAGRKHHGARAIIEVLRFYSATKEVGYSFKINNNASPYLGRVFNDIYGNGFFEERECKEDVYQRHEENE